MLVGLMFRNAESRKRQEGSGKVLLLCYAFPPAVGGIQRFLSGLSIAYPSQRLVVLAPSMQDASDFDREQSCQVARYPSLSAGSKLPTKLAGLLDLPLVLLHATIIAIRENITHICVGEVNLMLLLPASLLRWLFGLKLYLFGYGSDFLHVTSPWLRLVLATIIRSADGAMTDSKYAGIRLIEFSDISPDKVYVVNPGIDNEWLNKARLVKEANNKKAPHKTLLTVGRLVARKGHDMVLRALPTVLQDFPDLRYKIVGDGPYLSTLLQLTKELQIQESVDFIGKVSDDELMSYYNDCDLFIMPSREASDGSDIEGFGIVFLEANLFGKPVIGGASGGISDAIVHGHTGLLVNPNKAEAIATSIILLLKDNNLATALGENGRERIFQELTYEHVAKRVQRILHSN